MADDIVDELLGQWNELEPDRDWSGIGVVVRIQRLAKLLQQGTERALAPLDLRLWEYDVLSALRRQGPPFQLPAHALARAALLTSGAMTTRIDRLVDKGLVSRLPRAEDRRGVAIILSPAGLELVERALTARMAAAEEQLESIGLDERRALAASLRKLLLAASDPDGPQPS
ncbi:MAG: MarR family transcriptional regulator [Chromatiales bacterium]|nr:MarR family transcriptional regulator [Chromatiales bacterium]